MSSSAPIINYSILATNALAFTIAFSWNTAVSRALQRVTGSDPSRSALHAIVSAAVLTVMVILIVFIINLRFERPAGTEPQAPAPWVRHLQLRQDHGQEQDKN